MISAVSDIAHVASVITDTAKPVVDKAIVDMQHVQTAVSQVTSKNLAQTLQKERDKISKEVNTSTDTQVNQLSVADRVTRVETALDATKQAISALAPQLNVETKTYITKQCLEAIYSTLGELLDLVVQVRNSTVS